MRVPTVAVVLGALVGSGSACRPDDACAEPGTACGGDPVGAWVQVDACQDPALQDSVAKKQPYRNQPTVPGGEAPPELTSTDWCAALVYNGPSGIELAGFPKVTPQIQGGYITYGSDGVYTTLITSSDSTSISYSTSCLERSGYPPGRCAACPTPPDPPDPSCGIENSFGEAFKAYGASIGGAKETHCVDSGDGGCRCSYVTEGDAAGDNRSGTWTRNGNVITHFAGIAILPTQVDYCVKGNVMTLWGHNRTNILDFDGLRTLALRKVVCGDGFTDRGEECDPNDPHPLTGASCSPTCMLIAAP